MGLTSEKTCIAWVCRSAVDNRQPECTHRWLPRQNAEFAFFANLQMQNLGAAPYSTKPSSSLARLLFTAFPTHTLLYNYLEAGHGLKTLAASGRTLTLEQDPGTAAGLASERRCAGLTDPPE